MPKIDTPDNEPRNNSEKDSKFLDLMFILLATSLAASIIIFIHYALETVAK